MAVLALAASQSETATVTGGYGTRVVSGDVVMAGVQSPAGVEVSVRATGMTTTLGADGRFSFAGIPEDAQLGLRSAFGQASLLLDGSSTIHVELPASGALESSKQHRGAGDSAEHEAQLTL